MRAVGRWSEKFGDQPLIDARLRGTIGDTYRRLGRYERAEPQLEAALETRKRVLGDEHPDTLSSMNNLAVLYWNQGRYDEAEPLYLETLETRKRVLGDDHPDTLSSMNNLADPVLEPGPLRRGRAAPPETLETRKRVLGDDHPNTLRSMNNLAILYDDQGRYDEAEPLYLETLETRKRVLGDDHPGTLSFHAQQPGHPVRGPGPLRRGRAALPRNPRDPRSACSGPDHPDTLRSMNNLANLYKNQGRYDEAEPLYLEALETSKARARGPTTRATLNSMNNLGDLYVAPGPVRRGRAALTQNPRDAQTRTRRQSPGHARLHVLPGMPRGRSSQPRSCHGLASSSGQRRVGRGGLDG